MAVPSAPSGPPWRREDGDSVVLSLHVQPGAKRTAIDGTYGEALKVRLAAPPVDGKANGELRRYLAEMFGVPLAAVTLVRGETSRQKTVRIASPARRPDRAWAQGQTLISGPAADEPANRPARK
jgi:uncharacterized protein (TIGR00251 family)